MERRQSSRLLSYRFCSCANVRYALLVWVADRPVFLARLTIASTYTLILYLRRVQGPQEAYPYGAKRSQSRALSPDCSKVKGSCCCCNPCAANAQFWTKGEGTSGKYPRQNGLGNLWFGSLQIPRKQRQPIHCKQRVPQHLQRSCTGAAASFLQVAAIAAFSAGPSLRSSVRMNRIHDAVVR